MATIPKMDWLSLTKIEIQSKYVTSAVFKFKIELDHKMVWIFDFIQICVEEFKNVPFVITLPSKPVLIM